jgi:hypothetical protein
MEIYTCAIKKMALEEGAGRGDGARIRRCKRGGGLRLIRP